MNVPVYSTVIDLIHRIEATQGPAIEAAALAMVSTIQKGGLIQAYGAGHSFAGALELCHRAGGLIPTKAIKEPSGGQYETVEGVGSLFVKKVDIRPEDTVVVISNSGRNPLPVELAFGVKAKGATLIVITAVEASKRLPSKHSSGKNLYQLGDIVLDNLVEEGDAMIELPQSKNRVCGMSMLTTSLLIQVLTYRVAVLLEEQGQVAPIYRSQNIEGGRAFNEALEAPYLDRLMRL
jgi:uncharacterized phosphosugar-binding protein